MKIKLIKPLFLLLGLLFLIGCQEDIIQESIESENNQLKKLIIEHKTLDEILKNETALRKPVQNIQQHHKDLTSSSYNFSFDETKVQVMQDSAYTQYTFLIKRDNPNYDVVENYICRVFDNDSVDQYITTYPVVETQDSIYLDYTSSSITTINDDTIIYGKSNLNNCVPVYTEITVIEAVPCTGAGHYPGSMACTCNDANPDNCSEAYYELGTQTLITYDCGGGSGDGDDSGDNSQNDTSDGSTSGQGGNISDPIDETEVITKPEEPEKLLKQPVREFLENLDDDKKDCYENSGFTLTDGLSGLMDDQLEAIEDFLSNNVVNEQINPEAAAFVEAILQDCDSDNEVDFEEKIIDELNNDCLNSVYNQLKELGVSDIASDYLSNFEGHSPVAHLRFTEGVDDEEPEAAAVTYPPDNFLIEIMFNPNELDRPETSVARTFMHEILHAEMYRKMLSLAQQDEIPWSEDFIDSLANDFPGLADYYTRWWLDTNGQSPTIVQHELMAQHYRATISNFLMQFDSSLSQDQADALAWVGLMGNGTFDATTGLFSNSTVAWQNVSQQSRLNILNEVESFYDNNPDC